MKKLFSYILLLAMALSLFAGCNQTEEAPDLTGLEKAKTYLYNLYKDSGVTTVANFDVVGVVVVQGYGTYNVEWSADSSAITFTPNGKMVTVNIPASPAEEIVYKLTAKISDDKGNSMSVSFDHRIPAGGNLSDGTYVILAGNLTLSSLTQDKSYGYPTANEVTVEGGKVSNHFQADVLTIKKVGDSYTIQDAYGRYFYLKGTYNSFNVSAEIPADGGHLFTIGKEGDGYTIVNDAMSKTLAYSTSYTSWGCYPELSDDHNAVLTILPATAPEKDPETPSDPSTPSEPSTPSTPSTPPTPSTGMITKPVAGTAYKFVITQGNLGKTLYFTGVPRDNQPWYITSTENEADAIDVFVEEVSGGLRLYFNINGAKNYLVMYKDDTHYSLKVTTEPSTVYSWNGEYNTFVAMNEDKKCFIGTSNNYNTFSCNKFDYIGTSFVAHLYGEGGTTTPSTPPATEPTTPSTPSNPSTGTDVTLTNGMKVVIYNPANGKALSSQPSAPSSYYQLGVDVTLSGSTLSGYGTTEIWTVIANSDGTFSFEQGGKKIAMGVEFGSMKMGEVNDKWEVISLGNGLYNIKNAARGNIMEWYASKNNWSTYTPSNPTTDPLFQLSFYVVP